MDKYEYKLLLDQMRALIDEQDYAGAAKVADQINWNKVRNVNTLCMVGKNYERVGRLDDAKDVYRKAMVHSPGAKNPLYRLTKLSIRTGDTAAADRYYREYIQNAPGDRARYALAYEISCAKNEPYQKRIALLEDLKDHEYTEEWAYELARVYAEAGMPEECVEACDEMVIWFGSGKYVQKALELKSKYQALPPEQKELYQQIKKDIAAEEAAETARIESARQARADAERAAQEEAERKAAEEEARIRKEEEERAAKAEAARKEREEQRAMDERMAAQIKKDRAADRSRWEEEDEEEEEFPRREKRQRGSFFGGFRKRGGSMYYEDEEEDEPIRKKSESGRKAKAAVPADDTKELPDVEVDIDALLKEEKEAADERFRMPVYQEPTYEVPKPPVYEIPKAPVYDVPETPAAPVTEAPAFEAPEAPAPKYDQPADIDLEAAVMAAVEEPEAPAPAAYQEPQTAPEDLDERIAATFSKNLGITATAASGSAPAKEEPAPVPEAPAEKLSIEDVLADWEVTKKAAEDALAAAEAEKAEADKAKALAEAGELMARLKALLPSLEQGLSDEQRKEIEAKAAEAKKAAEARKEEEYKAAEAAAVAAAEASVIRKEVPVAGQSVQVQTAVPAEPIADPASLGNTGVLPTEIDTTPVKPAEERTVWPTLKPPVEEPVRRATGRMPSDADLAAEAARRATGRMPSAADLAVESARRATGRMPSQAEIRAEAARRAGTVEVKSPVANESGLRPGDRTEDLQKYLGQEARNIMNEKRTEEQLIQPTKRMPVLTGEELEARAQAAAARRNTGKMPLADPDEPVLTGATKRMPALGAEGEVVSEPLFTLTEEQEELFSYFIPVPGMKEQICQAILGVSERTANALTSVSGNILIQGAAGSGKTVLATSLIKVIQETVGKQDAKIGKISAASLNKRGFASLVPKVAGGYLIIEKAGDLTRETIMAMSQIMEQRTNGLVIVLEDTREGIRNALSQDYSFAKKFTERITIPIFTIDELVEFGKAYAKEMECSIDEMGILAMYNRINNIQKVDRATTLTEVKEIIDEAIDSAEKGSGRRFGLFNKKYNDNDLLILHEQDFEK